MVGSALSTTPHESKPIWDVMAMLQCCLVGPAERLSRPGVPSGVDPVRRHGVP